MKRLSRSTILDRLRALKCLYDRKVAKSRQTGILLAGNNDREWIEGAIVTLTGGGVVHEPTLMEEANRLWKYLLLYQGTIK